MKTKKIENNIKLLHTQLYEIMCRNWIKSKGSGTGAAGSTLEMLLNKKNDTLSLPDYMGIELKTHREDSRYNISLFSMAFDSKPLEAKRLLELVGYKDKTDPNIKILCISMNALRLRKVGDRYLRIKINYERKKIYLYIYDSEFHIIDNTMYWSFEQLKIRLENKMNYMVLIPVRTYKLNEEKYFKYLNHTFYKLRSFDDFLKAIEKGYIYVTFKITYVKSGENYGKMDDHGTSFGISQQDLDKIYETIDIDSI